MPDPEAVKPSLSTTEVCVLLLCGVGDSVLFEHPHYTVSRARACNNLRVTED